MCFSAVNRDSSFILTLKRNCQSLRLQLYSQDFVSNIQGASFGPEPQNSTINSLYVSAFQINYVISIHIQEQIFVNIKLPDK